MLSGHQAFPIRDHDTESTFYSRIKRGDYDMSRSVWRRVSADAKDLLTSMLRVDPEKRVSASEALKHRWVVNNKGAVTEVVEERVNKKVLQKEARPRRPPPETPAQ